MVATLLKLRLRVLANSLKRSTWQLVATILGAAYALFLLGSAVAGLVALGLFAPLDVATTVVVIAGSVVVLGWMLFPLLLTGLDQTLDPARLAQFPIPMRTLLVALTLAGVLGIPGVVTTLAGLATVAVWVRHPLAAAAAVIGAVVGILTAVVASRAVTAATAGLQSNRRARELGGIVILVPLFLLGPIIIGVTQGLLTSADALPAVATGLGWSPLGAAWAVPAAVAAGDPVGALLRLLIAVATLAVLVLVWRRALARALVSPPASAARAGRRGRIGAFALVPQTPAGAVAARCLTYWRRDPRYARQLLFVPLLPLLLWLYSSFNDASDLMMWTGPLVAVTLALTLATDISYDGTAFATHVIDGVRGRDDRVGRLGALAVFSVPITIVFAIGGALLAQRPDHAPALLGLSLGALLTGFGVVSVSSARFVMQVPQAGDNPFTSSPGAGFTSALQLSAVWAVVLVLLIPTIALAALSFFTGVGAWGWGALACGIAVGLVVTVAGVRLGGALLDRTAPSLLVSLRRLREA